MVFAVPQGLRPRMQMSNLEREGPNWLPWNGFAQGDPARTVEPIAVDRQCSVGVPFSPNGCDFQRCHGIQIPFINNMPASEPNALNKYCTHVFMLFVVKFATIATRVFYGGRQWDNRDASRSRLSVSFQALARGSDQAPHLRYEAMPPTTAL